MPLHISPATIVLVVVALSANPTLATRLELQELQADGDHFVKVHNASEHGSGHIKEPPVQEANAMGPHSHIQEAGASWIVATASREHSIHEGPSSTSAVIGEKPRGAIVRGIQEGAWLKLVAEPGLVTEPGYLLIYESDTTFLTEAIGFYVTTTDRVVVGNSDALVRNTAEATKLNLGTIIEVLEVTTNEEDKRIRAKIKNPQGWISLMNTETGKWWAKAIYAEKSLRTTRDKFTFSQQTMKISPIDVNRQGFEQMRHGDTIVAVNDERVTTSERFLDTLNGTDEFKLTLRPNEAAPDQLGRYQITAHTGVDKDMMLPRTGTPPLVLLMPPTEIDVIELADVYEQTRLRAKIHKSRSRRTTIPEGWISLYRKEDGKRWATPKASTWNPLHYVLTRWTVVRAEPSLDSATVCERLEAGTYVEVVDVVHIPEEHRVRGKIRHPAGWISLVDTESGSAWVKTANMRAFSIEVSGSRVEAINGIYKQADEFYHGAPFWQKEPYVILKFPDDLRWYLSTIDRKQSDHRSGFLEQAEEDTTYALPTDVDMRWLEYYQDQWQMQEGPGEKFLVKVALPPETPGLIVDMFALRDVATLSAQDVQHMLEIRFQLPRDALKPHEFRIEYLVTAEANRVKAEANHKYRPTSEMIGSDCLGGGWLDFDDGWNWKIDQGTCPLRILHCYGQDGKPAAKDAAGKCFVKYQGRCYQATPGDGTSGGCFSKLAWQLDQGRDSTKRILCRAFSTWSQSGQIYGHNFGETHTGDIKYKSFCVDPNSDEDNRLKFLEYWQIQGFETFNAHRIYKTD